MGGWTGGMDSPPATTELTRAQLAASARPAAFGYNEIVTTDLPGNLWRP
jgi:hypothetical protein